MNNLQRLSQFFPIVLLIYFAVQLFLRINITPIAVLDESEQVMLSQYFSWGYNEQPPLYTWMQIAVFKLFGNNVFALSLLKNSLLFTTYFSTFLIGNYVIQDRVYSMLATLSLLMMPQIVWGSLVDQTHTIFLTTMTALTWLYFLKLTDKEQISNIQYAFFGLLIGMGLLSKYNFVLVVVSIIILSLIIHEFRQKFYNKKIFISVGVASALVLPHFVWFLTHLTQATNRTLGRMSQEGEQTYSVLVGIGELMLSYTLFLTPFWIIFAFFFRKNFQIKLNNTKQKVLAYYFAIVFTLLLLVVVFLEVNNIKERWLQPYLFLVPVLLFSMLQKNQISDKSNRSYLYVSLFFALSAAAIFFMKPFFIDIRGKASKLNYPFKVLTEQIRSQVHGDKILIHAEDKYMGGNIKLFFPTSKVITPSLPNQTYDLSDEIVAIFEHKEPQEFLLAIKSQGYVCHTLQKEIPLTHSSELTYKVKMIICKMRNDGK